MGQPVGLHGPAHQNVKNASPPLKRTNMPRLVIDGLETEVPEGTKVIDAAEQLGIMIPRFCYLKTLGSVGACRMCAVKFLQGPFKGVQMSCMVDAQDGMVVSTTDEEAVAFRKQVIEWLMLNHPHDCPVCDEGGQCLLQDETVSGGHGIRRYKGKKRTYRNQYLGVFIAHEMNRCIHCYRCSRFYQDYCGYRDLGVLQIADRVFFGRFQDGQLENPFSGNLVDICPTGVYTDLPARFKVRSWDLDRAPSLCIHCSLGCNTVANARYRTVWRVEGRPNEKLGSEFICDRGRFGFDYTNQPSRPRQARIGTRHCRGEEGIREAAQKLAQIQSLHGPRAIAALGSTRSSLETQAMLKGFCRVLQWAGPHFFMNPRTEQKVRSAVARLDERLAVSLGEVAEADFILAVGVDPLQEAPMLALALRQAHRRGASILLADPRPCSLPAPVVHLPVLPGEFEACLSGLFKEALTPVEEDSLGVSCRAFWDSLPADFSLPPALEEARREGLLALQASRNPVIVCGTDAVTESTPSFCSDLALLLREARGRCGLFYVMPGANAFGGALFSRSKSSTFLDVIQSIEAGAVKALLLVESDPFFSFPDRKRLESALEKLDLLMVLDHLPSESVQRAQIFLPTSTLFETRSTFINQEGRVQCAEAVHLGGIPMSQWTGGTHPPRVHTQEIPGSDPQPAWMVLWKMAEAMDAPGMPASPSPWSFLDEGDRLLLRLESRQLPCDGERVVFRECSDNPPSPPSLSESSDAGADSLELLLAEATFGTEELSAHSEAIGRVEPEPHVWMQAQDAKRLGLVPGEMVVLHLDGGPLQARLNVAESMARGILVLPRHHRLQWQKLKDFSVRVPLDRIGKS